MKTVLKDDFIDGWIAQGLAQGRVQGLAQGLAQGRAEMLLEFLEMRFSVPDAIRKRIEECNDTDQIKTWSKRVLSAASLDELFA